jgi:hypothetical protein
MAGSPSEDSRWRVGNVENIPSRSGMFCFTFSSLLYFSVFIYLFYFVMRVSLCVAFSLEIASLVKQHSS